MIRQRLLLVSLKGEYYKQYSINYKSNTMVQEVYYVCSKEKQVNSNK